MVSKRYLNWVVLASLDQKGETDLYLPKEQRASFKRTVALTIISSTEMSLLVQKFCWAEVIVYPPLTVLSPKTEEKKLPTIVSGNF